MYFVVRIYLLTGVPRIPDGAFRIIFVFVRGGWRESERSYHAPRNAAMSSNVYLLVDSFIVGFTSRRDGVRSFGDTVVFSAVWYVLANIVWCDRVEQYSAVGGPVLR